MEQSISNINLSIIISEIFKQNKIQNICICPGSRNTPLNNVFIKDIFFNCSTHIDERSAAFFSLGITKSSLKPTVIITTSGTAVANLMPAIIESDLSTNPLIILTADRPKRLLNTGANQAINQKKIFNSFVRGAIHIENMKLKSLKKIQSDIQNLINKSIGIENQLPPGPIHINIGFDEPLLDKKEPINFKHTIKKQNSTINKKLIIQKYKKPLIICGPLSTDINSKQIIKLSKQLNSPIFAESTSQMRYLKKHKHIFSYYDFYINKLDIQPDCIIRFGKKPISKKLNSFLENFKNKIILISKYSNYNDDAKFIYHDIDENKINIKPNKAWFNKIYQAELSTKKHINKYIEKNIFFEGNIIFSCVSKLKNNDNLFIGNSLPIRNLNKYYPNTNQKINIYCNRGASGIDGIISTALGISYQSKKQRNVLIIGDVSFFYDFSSLLLAKKYSLNLTIIIINNNGGQIFSTLPYKNEINLDPYWTTPVDLDINNITKLYSMNYYRLQTIKNINNKLDNIINKPGANIVEIPCNFSKTSKVEKEIKSKL
ncbi:MAG: 2-succinyl-5-enolpyruvyl-6-hydroxy-3-cyclohexene-1-carboxylic-acid synthase [Candidatus Marinimicrobia bacterium]|nr:2-succinyl-5-enolpyruvyl-6-hydroxy-3-cyclohexene-1-carboxylic-acid synthase [Candidatus Neomarinimicrobiota bacterium]